MKVFTIIFLLSFSVAADERINKALQHGVAYLLEKQNPDGSWSSPGRTKEIDIYAPGPRAHLAYKTACTALDLLALGTLPEKSDEVKKAIRRGALYLIKTAPEIKRAEGMWVGNTWSHPYIVKAFLKLRKLDFLKDLKEELDKTINHQLKQMAAFQALDGGWSYYNFGVSTNVPSDGSMSFITATCLIVFKEAVQEGFPVDENVINRAVKNLKSQRRPDGNFLYSADFKFHTGAEINGNYGGLGRIHGCTRALYEWNEEKAKEVNFDELLKRLIEKNGWLDMIRKRPIPHEGWYAIAGYFYYYGHYYASENLALCKNKKEYAQQLAELMIAKQEKSGAWFDFALYDYGHFYGTAFAMLILINCQKEV